MDCLAVSILNNWMVDCKLCKVTLPCSSYRKIMQSVVKMFIEHKLLTVVW